MQATTISGCFDVITCKASFKSLVSSTDQPRPRRYPFEDFSPLGDAEISRILLLNFTTMSHFGTFVSLIDKTKVELLVRALSFEIGFGLGRSPTKPRIGNEFS